jgi:translation initiation factor 2 alpha subunit (eIF-2alpha)
MSELDFDELVAKATKYNSYSETYAQSQLYASRNENTGINEICQAVNVARNVKVERTNTDLYDILTNDAEFRSAERELKQSISKIVDTHIKIDKRYNLSPKQSNELLELLTKKLRTNLFTETKLSK